MRFNIKHLSILLMIFCFGIVSAFLTPQIINPSEVTDKWKIFTTSLANIDHPLNNPEGLNTPLHPVYSEKDDDAKNNVTYPNKAIENLWLKGTAILGPAHWKGFNSFEHRIFEEYVKPRDLENGVIVMNKDRIPKYLKRTLGL